MAAKKKKTTKKKSSSKRKAPKRKLHLCIDRVLPIDLVGVAAELAMDENPKNGPPKRPRQQGITANHALRLALETKKLWKNGRTLGVRFIGGTKTQRTKTEQFARYWEPFANIKFNFKGGAKAEIRVAFEQDGSSWSGVGTECLVTDYFPKNEPTMNFGWLDDDTDDQEWERVVVHEFGHALGAIHEHQNPKAGLKWNLAAVYKYFSGPPNNWSKPEIDSNIVNKYSAATLNATDFDRDSIMLYSFPPALIVGGKGTKENSHLSKNDKKFIGKMYPKNK